MKIFYLDNAATTKIEPLVLKAMLSSLEQEYGNASSIHNLGQKARQEVERARKQIADFLHCSGTEIVFTNGATESDNLAIFGVVEAVVNQNSQRHKPHIITSSIEHPAVLEPYKELQKKGRAEVDFLLIHKEGIVRVEDVKKAIKPNTCLVSIMYANNEIGAIQPIAEIGALLKEINKNRKEKIHFHCDAVQAVNYLDCAVDKLGVDLLTLSGHKIYGPKGVGVLYVRKNTKLEPRVFGGHQEMGLRPGTENTAGIIGLGKAIELLKETKNKIADIGKLRDKLIDGILQKIPRSRLNGSKENRLPNNANFSFNGAEGEAIVMALDQKGIACSTGSACSSGSLEPSFVLKAIGLSNEQAHGSVRFSLGKYNTEKEIDYVLQILPEIVQRLRHISGRG